MATLHKFDAGGYAFLEGGHPYSAGVIAQDGFGIVRARFARVLPVNEGFAAIEALLTGMGRPLTALCAAELRSPAPFDMGGFKAFNNGYVDVLRRWGLIHDGTVPNLNPVARSNVCPRFDAPAEPGFFAFSYTVPTAARPAQGAPFVVAGSGEWPEDQPFPEGVVARGDLSATGLSAKAAYVLRTMRERCDGLGGNWSALTGAQVYTLHDFHPFLESHFAPAGLTRQALEWQVCAPPIREIEFEMDVRRCPMELVIG